MKKIDLRKVEDAREFLGSIKVDGRQVTEFTLANGRTITVEKMTDAEAIRYANDFYLDWLKGNPDGGVVDTDIDRGLN